MKRKSWPMLLAAVLLCLLLSGCAAKTQAGVLYADAALRSPYAGTVLDALPDAVLLERSGNPYAALSQGCALACFDAQAVPAAGQNVGRYWYPQGLATVVIAVNASQTDAEITGWRTLEASGAVVQLLPYSAQDRLVLAAMSYGLEGENYTKQAAIDLLECLYAQDRLQFGGKTTAVRICFDDQAAAWNRAGENWEIVVPEEGTLSFVMGVLSDTPVRFADGLDEALLDAGVALADGRRPEDYPDDEAYRPAVRTEDFAHLLSVTENTDADLRRAVRHTRLFSSADQREHTAVALLVCAAAIFWMSTVLQRIMRQDVRWTAVFVGCLVVGWSLLRLFKYQLPAPSTVSRYCWYGYYLFQLALPLAMLWLAKIVDQPENTCHPLKPLWKPLALYLLAVMLVFTNDLHQLVFRFDLNGDWSSDYHYGPGYFAVLLAALGDLLAAILLLFKKCRRSRYPGARLFPLLFVLAIVLYLLGYLLQLPLARDSDYTITICVLAMLFFESVLRTGLIPVNTRYARLFAAAPLNLQLLDEDGQPVLSANGASAIPRSAWESLRANPAKPLLWKENTLLHGAKIRGGMAVWQEDITALNHTRREIQTASARMESANALLREEGAIRHRLLAAEEEAALFDDLERELPERAAVLAGLIRTLPQAADRRRQIGCICLCLCHIKRRYNLFFLRRKGEPIPGEELGIYLDELSELAGYAGVKALTHCALREALEVRHASLCYDFYFETLFWAAQAQCSSMLGELIREDGAMVFRLLPAITPEALHYTGELQEAIRAASGSLTRKDLDETAGLWLHIPDGGENHG